MLSKSGQQAIVFNGEIYGYLKIKRKLSNYPFKTTSDTEVILAMYEKYGHKLFPQLPGMPGCGEAETAEHIEFTSPWRCHLRTPRVALH